MCRLWLLGVYGSLCLLTTAVAQETAAQEAASQETASQETASQETAAQELAVPPGPQKEHEWLQQFVGEWATETEASMGPGLPAMKCTGRMQVRMLGGRWMLSESTAEMMGMRVDAVQTIGYDVQAQKYVGTWVDSMLDHIWQYEGTVDSSGRKLTLNTEGPNFMLQGKLSKFRDVYEFTSQDQFAISSQMLGEDGKWVTFMSGAATRKP